MLTDVSTTVWVESLAAELTKEGHVCTAHIKPAAKRFSGLSVFFLVFLKPCAPVNTNEKTQNV